MMNNKKKKDNFKQNIVNANNRVKEIVSAINSYVVDRENYSINETELGTEITIDLREGDIYQVYSGKNFLSPDVFDYLETVFKFIKHKARPLILHFIFPDKMSNEEKAKIIRLYRVHYAIEYDSTKQEIKKTNVIATILLLIGLLIMTVYYALSKMSVEKVIQDIVTIFGWVFIWEACNNFAFENFRNRLNRSKYMLLFTAKID